MNGDTKHSLYESLSKYTPISPAEWQRMEALLRPQTLQKNAFFVTAGSTSDQMAFIESGVFRVFCMTEKGDDKTLAFRTKGQTLSVFTPSVEGIECWYSIQALEPSCLWCIGTQDFMRLRAESVCWERFFSAYLTHLFIEKETRERSFLTEDAQTRYMRFKLHYPDLERSIYDYHIASYLGISPVTLSRLRNS